MLVLSTGAVRLNNDKIQDEEFAIAFGYIYEQAGFYYKSILDLPHPERHSKWDKIVDELRAGLITVKEGRKLLGFD